MHVMWIVDKIKATSFYELEDVELFPFAHFPTSDPPIVEITIQ